MTIKKKYAIDGLFLTQRITGIQRVAFELVKALDKIVKKNEIIIIAPDTELTNIELTNISVVKYGRLKGIAWQQICFAYYLWKNDLNALCLTNILPLLYRRGMIMLHDVSYKANPCFFTSKRDRLSAIWHRLNYYLAAKSKMTILTVSNFSKSEIKKYYSVPDKRIHVIYNAWQHMDSVGKSEEVFKKNIEIKKSEYFFSMATMAPNKNYKWIVNAAKNNPDKIFVIAGGGNLSVEGLNNLIILGYVTDEDAKALMGNCKAFIFPTFYEGFGLPPLEAIACGAPEIIVSDTPCMREIYRNYANYLDPNNYSCLIIRESTKYNRDLLEQYSWIVSADKLYALLNITNPSFAVQY